MTTVAILIPGSTGTTLINSQTGAVIWPTAVKTAVQNHDVDTALALIEDKDGVLVPQEPAGWNDDAASYGNLQSWFVSRGFVPAVATSGNDVPSSLTSNHLIGMAYDWRNDNRQNATVLGDILNAVAAAAGDDVQLWLIGHSMGGLVARALLEPAAASGATQPSWFSKIQGLITLGTPHLGAPLALQAILGNLPPELGLEMTAFATAFVDKNGDPEWDSSYELLPPPNQQFITSSDATPESVFNLDLRAAASLIRHGASSEFLNEAQSFFGTLTYNDAEGLPAYYCVYGVVTELPTTTGFRYHPLLDSWAAVPTFGGGDVIVPANSAQFALRTVAGTYAANGVDHGQLPANAGVQSYIGQVMHLPS